MQQRMSRILLQRGIRMELGDPVDSVVMKDCGGGKLVCESGKEIDFDECMWCTQAGCAEWMKGTGLTLDADGFVLVEDTLEAVGQSGIFAAGDCAAMKNHPRPKAGVFAVRAGPPLRENIRRCLLREPLLPYIPQQEFLSILGTGDRYAVASRAGWCAEGAPIWLLKEWIDRKWMRSYQDLPVMQMPQATPPAVAHAEAELAAFSHSGMRCGGCGCKVGATVLSRALARVKPLLTTNSDVIVGLEAPDDAALVRAPPPGEVLVQTVDFFRGFIDDPYVFGQVAANHALSDCHAMCARPQTALAIVVVPYAPEDKVEDTLVQLMAGACAALGEAGCALVGGHTSEGAELALGFAVNGTVDPTRALKKSGMCVGDALILTKPIGTGVVLAANMRVAAQAHWVSDTLQSMLLSNAAAATVISECGATSCTDVTGFGLVGHLSEMVKASGVSVRLDIDAIPLLAGAKECVQLGIASSLYPQNELFSRHIANQEETAKHEIYALLFDPQTAGGLLLTVPDAKAADCVASLRRSGYPCATICGGVTEALGGAPKIICTGTGISVQ
eukprot:TRINITY_DN8071_c0_g1_i1.p1 TRINITY_DN8071_c0_g1~~TRINITY_DN8071_c0_g1_i1.p1  ORF type:complete len:559 (+),score=76.79 TRINITY_DN8071_c0_g1_i1:794-2470(+)